MLSEPQTLSDTLTLLTKMASNKHAFKPTAKEIFKRYTEKWPRTKAEAYVESDDSDGSADDGTGDGDDSDAADGGVDHGGHGSDGDWE